MSDMPASDHYMSFAATGGETRLDVDWQVDSEEGVRIVRTRGGLAVQLVLAVDYTIGQLVNPRGAIVTLLAPAVAGDVYEVLDLAPGLERPVVHMLGLWRGAWTAAAVYRENDTVLADGSSYICLAPHVAATNNRPDTGVDQATYWSLVAAKGDQGLQGPVGDVTPAVTAAVAAAAGSASAAAVSATASAASATAASGSATAASGSAAAASGSAAAASGSAAAASGSASAAAASASAAAGSLASVSAAAPSSFSGVSTTSVAVPSVGGTFSLTASTGKGWLPGMVLQVASSGSTAVVTGSVQSYDAGTGALVLVATAIAGSGTHADWLIGALQAAASGGDAATMQIFSDPFFDVTRGDATARIDGGLVFDAVWANRVWVSDYTHSKGVGAWKYPASASLIAGFNSYLPPGVGSDDTLSMAVIVKAAAGTRIALDGRFFSGSSNVAVGSSFGATYVTATGGEDLISIPLRSIPAGATGVTAWVYNGATTGDVYICAHWVTINTAAGNVPALRRPSRVDAFAQRRAAVDDWSMIASALKPTTTVSVGSTTTVTTASGLSSNARNTDFGGWGDTYTTPGSISFNAVRLPLLGRGPSAPKWSRAHVVVRTHATAPAGSGTTIVAVGDVYVDEDATSISNVVVPLRDPVSGAFKTVTQADLAAQFLVGYFVWQRDNSGGICNDVLGTISGITRAGASFYARPTDSPDVSSWMTYSGNPALAIELLTVTTPAQTIVGHITAALAAELGLSASQLSVPTPTAPILPARLFGMVGREMNVYLASMHSGLTARDYDVTCSLGTQQRERWTLTPVATADNTAFAVDVRDLDTLVVLGTASCTVDVASATAAAGVSKKILCIGDSLTAAGSYTQRLLDIAAANASALQPTLLGTLGTGSNKHEGRGGWTLDGCFQQATHGGSPNPFYNAGKFDLAYYLTNNSISTPDAVFIHLGINDVFSLTTDALVNSLMDTWCDQMSRVIGLTADATVGAIRESNAACAVFIGLVVTPTPDQSGFGHDYGSAQSMARVRRNIAVASYRIKQAFGALEASKVFLVPWNATVDPVNGFPSETVAANATTATTVVRASNSVHPASSGYLQLGDALYAALNWATVKGKM